MLAPSPHRPATPGELALLAPLFLLAALASLALPRAADLPLAWPLAPLLAANLLMRASAAWPLLLATALCAGAAACAALGEPLLAGACWLAGTLASATLAAWLWRRFGGRLDSMDESLPQLSRFVGLCAGVAPAVGALAVLPLADNGEAATDWLTALLQGAIGMCALLPPLLLGSVRGLAAFRMLRTKRGAVLVLAIGLVCAFSLNQRVAGPFALIACGLIATVSLLDFAAIAVLVLESALMSALLLSQLSSGDYLLGPALQNGDLLLRELFALLLAQLLSVSLGAARRREEQMRTAEENVRALSMRLAMATRAGRVGYWDVDLVRNVVEWDAQMFEFNWYPAGRFVTQEMWRARVHPQDLPAALEEIRSAVRGTGSGRFEMRLRGPRGEERTLEMVYTVQRGADGRAVQIAGLSWDVSREREFELAIARSHRELQSIIDNIPGLVGYWDAALHLRFANRAYCEWIGMPLAQLRGLHISEALGEERYAASMPYVHAALAGEAQVFERSETDAGGRLRNTLVSLAPDIEEERTKGFFVFVNDITPLRRARDARQEAETALRSVIDAASDFSIVATDLDGTIRLFSAGAERLLGYRADEMVGRSTPVRLHDAAELEAAARELSEQRGRVIAGFEVFVDSARQGKTETREWTYVRRDGSRVPVSLVVSGLRNARGELDGFLGVAADITGRRQVEHELRAASDAAQAASRAKSEFVANMSHELRTPMNAVLGLAHLLGNTPLTAEQRKYVDMIRGSGQSLMGIVNDILDFSKIEAGRMEVTPLPFMLENVLDNIANIMSISVGDAGIALAIDVDPDTPQAFVGDAMRLQQVLVNLAGNAAKFTESGEIVLRVRFERHAQDGACLDITLSDTGIGISAEQQARLFAPFAQADSSVTRRFGGTGLGLAITRRLVEMMGGRIDVSSELGAGSEFRVRLPFVPAAGAVEKLPPPRHLLILDTHAAGLLSLRHAAVRLGWTVRAADTPQRAAAMLEDGDLLLVAWHFLARDDADMRDLYAAARDREVSLLALASARGREQLMRAGAAVDGYLQQPLTRHSLQEGIAALAHAGEAPVEVPKITPPAATLRCDGARILLVEDNQVNQLVARVALEQAGAQVTVANHGAEALDCLRAAPGAYDLVLMDVQMPVLDGFSATRRIREELRLSLPIIAMTAGVLDTERERCMASGMDDFLAKPIEVPLLHAMVRRHWRGAQLESLFDPSSLTSLDSGNAAFQESVRALVRQLVTEGLSGVAAARVDWQGGDKAAAARRMHTLRGSLGTLGAKRMHTASLALEHALADGDEAAIRAAQEMAEEVRDATLAAARAWLEK